MKLQDELTNIENTFKANLPVIKDHAAYLKENGGYKDFDLRLTWDCLHGILGTKIICGWYDKYNCNDTHITTAGKRALSNLGII